jgi:hypothetical protein
MTNLIGAAVQDSQKTLITETIKPKSEMKRKIDLFDSRLTHSAYHLELVRRIATYSSPSEARAELGREWALLGE